MKNKQQEQKCSSTIPVLFCLNKSYIQHLIVLLTSILENNKGIFFDFYIFSTDFSDSEKELLNNVQKKYENCAFNHQTVAKKTLKNFKIVDKERQDISLETYYRYLAPQLITKYDKLLYLDTDTIVDGDLTPLWETDLEDCYFGGVPERCLYQKRYVFDKLKFSRDDLYINAGMLLMNLKKMREDNFVDLFLKAGPKLLPFITYSGQDIVNILAKGHIKQIECIYNMTPAHIMDLPGKKHQAVIVHYTGKFKPWSLGMSNNELEFLYEKYLNQSVLATEIKVKNFCVYHKSGYLFKNDLITPIQTGTYGLHTGMDMLQAGDGEKSNPDKRNQHYGELSAWYAVWKEYLPQHPEVEYVGFCHYRRMLDYQHPAPTNGFLTPISLSEFIHTCNNDYNVQDVYEIIKDYDIVLPGRYEIPDQTIEQQYLTHHPKKELQLLKQIIRENHPEYVPETAEVLNSKSGYFCLLWTMKKELFIQFMEFAFSILSELEKRSNWQQYTAYDSIRVPAFLIERFFNVWLLHNQKLHRWKILERNAYLLEFDPKEANGALPCPPPFSRFKYLKYKVLSKITRGKKRQKYKQKYKKQKTIRKMHR